MFQVPSSRFVCWVLVRGSWREFQVRPAPRTANSEPRTLNQNHEHEPGTRNREPGTEAPPRLIVGVSTRAAADSGCVSGLRRDCARCLCRPRSASVGAGAVIAARLRDDVFSQAVVNVARDSRAMRSVLFSSLENHSRAVDALTTERALWGNRSMCCVACEIPRALAAAFTKRAFARRVSSRATRRCHDPMKSSGGCSNRMYREAATA